MQRKSLQSIEEVDVETAASNLMAKKDPLKDEVSTMALVKGKALRGFSIASNVVHNTNTYFKHQTLDETVSKLEFT